jgi:hypothetical protein
MTQSASMHFIRTVITRLRPFASYASLITNAFNNPTCTNTYKYPKSVSPPHCEGKVPVNPTMRVKNLCRPNHEHISLEVVVQVMTLCAIQYTVTA